MHRFGVVSLLVLSQLALAGPARRALVVGIDAYDPPPLMDGGVRDDTRHWASLDGAVNDAESIARILRERYGFPASNIVTLTNEKATRAAILGGLAALARDSKSGDEVVFYYAGHGAQQPNSLSTEWDKKDETLVPADWHAGAADIRDKELAVALGAILDRSVELTAVFDSCHSGSNTRGVGKTRRMDEAIGDAKDPLQIVEDPAKCQTGAKCVVAPEARGALVMSATQDSELAREARDDQNRPHGAFTWALIRAIEDGPQVSVEKLFARVAARMQLTPSQHPELRGSAARRARTLIGEDAPREQQYPIVVSNVSGKTVMLQAGSAAGLAPGCELAATKGKARLRVTEVRGLTQSSATLLTPETPTIGNEFRVTKWTRGAFTPLYIFAPTPVSQSQWDSLVAQRDALFKNQALRVVDDPVDSEADGVVIWDGTAWQMVGGGRTVSLGARLASDAVLGALRVAAARVAVLLPPRAPLSLAGWNDASSVVRRVEQLDTADYAFVATRRQGKFQWGLVNVKAFSSVPLTMPARTEWIADSDIRLQTALDEKSWALARIKGWLTLDRPGPQGAPWELAVESTSSEAHDGALLAGLGEKLRVSLKPTGNTSDARRYYVYLMAIASDGSSTELYPLGKDNNAFVAGTEPIVLMDDVLVQEPVGIDHLIMVATEEKLASTSMLTTSAVRARGPSVESGFGALLEGVGVRGLGAPTPSGWDVQRTSLQTVRPWATAEAKPPGKSRGQLPKEGPRITVVQPTGNTGRLPVDIELRFEPRNAPVDVDSLKVELVSLVDIDVTKLVRSASVVTSTGLKSKTTQPGKSRVRVTLADLEGKKTAVEFEFEGTP